MAGVVARLSVPLPVPLSLSMSDLIHFVYVSYTVTVRPWPSWVVGADVVAGVVAGVSVPLPLPLSVLMTRGSPTDRSSVYITHASPFANHGMFDTIA